VRGKWKGSEVPLAIVIRNRVLCTIIYMYLWLILYRSYDAPTGYLPLTYLPSRPPSLTHSLTVQYLSRKRRMYCLAICDGDGVASLLTLAKCQGQGGDESAPCHLQTLPLSTSQFLAGSSNLILPDAAIHLDMVTCPPGTQRHGSSSCCPGCPVHASDMYPVCQQWRVTAQKHARPTPGQTCPRLSNQS
jgi:hypothetical protein